MSVFLEFSRLQQSKIRFALTFNAYKWILSLQKLLKELLLFFLLLLLLLLCYYHYCFLVIVLVLFLLSISFAFLGCFQLLNYVNLVVGPIVYHNGNDMPKYELKQQFSYTSAYMLGGWTLTCCGTGEDNISWSVSVQDQQSLWISLQYWVNFGAFRVQWMNGEAEISKTIMAYANNNGFMLFSMVIDDERGLEWLCFTYTRKSMFRYPRQI